MCKFKVSLFEPISAETSNIITPDSLNTIIADKVASINEENIERFVRLLTNYGCAFCPAIFVDGRRNIDSFDQQQLFVLDFNDEVSFGEISDRAKAYHLPILFAYEVSGDGDTNRFRIVFLNNAPIKYAKVAEIVTEALRTIFPESNPMSRNLTSIFLGGKGLIHFDESIPMIEISTLIMNMALYLNDRHGVTNYRRHIYEFSRLTGLALNENRMPDVTIKEGLDDRMDEDDDNLSPRTTVYIIENGEKLSNGSQSYCQIRVNDDGVVHKSPDKNPRIHQPYRSTDLATIGESCKLFRKFATGDWILTHAELIGLASNLIQVESAKGRFLSMIEVQACTCDDIKMYRDWKFYINYMKKTNCQPYSCDWFCTYRTQCKHSTNILSTAKPKYHYVQKLANSDERFCRIDEAEEDFREKLGTAIKANDKRIHVINAPIAIGKSTAVLDLMEGNTQRILFCFPTNDLKNEQYAKAVARGIDVVKSPSLSESKDILPEKVWRYIEYLYQIGKPHAVTCYIKDVMKKEKLSRQCLQALEDYQKDLIKFYSSNCHAFTTHSRLLTLNHWELEKYDAVIIDEDIILNCMTINQIHIPFSTLTKILDSLDTESELTKKISLAAKAAKTKSLFTLPQIKYDIAYDGISMGVDIPSFCRTEKFYFKKTSDENDLSESSHLVDSLVFLKPLKLEHNVKYIMMSATADEAICNYCFGSQWVEFYQCKKAKYTGTLNQHTDGTMSRAYIDKNPGIIDKTMKATGFENLITFKKHKSQGIYFGKTTGIDLLKGKDLNVIGTPHHPAWIYKLFAYTLGFDVSENVRMFSRIVRYKDFSFRFMTFNDELLRSIQFWMIESELEQAVGRARLLRENCTVNLFSNFPLSQAVLKD